MDRLHRNARGLRNHPTDAERHLWRHLRGRQLDGFRFRRQVPIAGYVADFFCPQARLVIELDGGQHMEQGAADGRRSAVLVGSGIVWCGIGMTMFCFGRMTWWLIFIGS